MCPSISVYPREFSSWNLISVHIDRNRSSLSNRQELQNSTIQRTSNVRSRTTPATTSSLIALLEVLASQAALSLESASLDEKEALLKEVNHRVKNNLQLISSFLNLQAARIADPAIAEQLADSRNRVRSIGRNVTRSPEVSISTACSCRSAQRRD